MDRVTIFNIQDVLGFAQNDIKLSSEKKVHTSYF